VSIYKALKELGFRKDGTSLHLLQIAMDEQAGLRAEKFREYLIDRYGQEITLEGTRKALTKLVSQGFLKTERPTPKHPFYLPNETGILLLRMAVDNIYGQLKIKPVAFDKFRATSVDFYSRSGEERSLANFETKLIESEMETKGNVASWGRHWWFLKGYKESH
jgi:hypothetical protein